jgi:hypothetical protein
VKKERLAPNLPEPACPVSQTGQGRFLFTVPAGLAFLGPTKLARQIFMAVSRLVRVQLGSGLHRKLTNYVWDMFHTGIRPPPVYI